MKSYEAMFLMDAALATDWTAAEAEVKRILERASAKVLGLKKWDERKLAYPIGQNKRGLYALAFFEASPEKITGIERDVPDPYYGGADGFENVYRMIREASETLLSRL